jgi:hypothetical protein
VLTDSLSAAINVAIGIFSPDQMRKPDTKKRGKPEYNNIFTFSSTDSLTTFQGKILHYISKYLRSSCTLDLNNFTIKFTIPRLVSNPVELEDQQTYSDMIKLIKGKEMNMTVTVEPLQVSQRRSL